MFVGVAKVRLHIAENQSLKGKRQVIKPIIARVKNQFNVSIAEIADQDLWQTAELGICCVSADAQHADEMLAKVVAFIESVRLDAEVGEVETEILPI